MRSSEKTGDLLPEVKGLVVGVIDRDQQTIAVDAEFLVIRFQAWVIASS